MLTEEQMWEIIDNTAEPSVVAEHLELMQKDERYRHTFLQYTSLQDHLLQLDLEAPSMRFTENVMERLLPHSELARRVDRAPLVFTLFMSLLSGAMVYMMSSLSAPSAGVSNSDYWRESFMSAMSNPMLVYGFGIINIILLLAIIDKKFLQPYFEKKMQKL